MKRSEEKSTEVGRRKELKEKLFSKPNISLELIKIIY